MQTHTHTHTHTHTQTLTHTHTHAHTRAHTHTHTHTYTQGLNAASLPNQTGSCFIVKIQDKHTSNQILQRGLSF